MQIEKQTNASLEQYINDRIGPKSPEIKLDNLEGVIDHKTRQKVES